ncbi:MAG: endonuclease/exonuclease/phosphatase family protein [Rickettsiales bacterium]
MPSIATWNINSIRMRMPLLLDYLTVHKPDILLLQEIKVETAGFPYLEIESLGYNCAVHGQKSYNGVAILSKFPIDEVVTVLGGDEEDAQSRYIEAAIVSLPNEAWRVASVYVPKRAERGFR